MKPGISSPDNCPTVGRLFTHNQTPNSRPIEEEILLVTCRYNISPRIEKKKNEQKLDRLQIYTSTLGRRSAGFICLPSKAGLY